MGGVYESTRKEYLLPAKLESETYHQTLGQLPPIDLGSVERRGYVEIEMPEYCHAKACIGFFCSREVLPVAQS
jgi:hypothetical protein